MCGRSGAYLQFVSPDKFTLHKGEDRLTSYKFNRNIIDHVFCNTCGLKPFARGKGPKVNMIANQRALPRRHQHVRRTTKQFDGRAV